MSRTDSRCLASWIAREQEVVVLPTPPGRGRASAEEVGSRDSRVLTLSTDKDPPGVVTQLAIINEPLVERESKGGT
jgi:hypothetical protein